MKDLLHLVQNAEKMIEINKPWADPLSFVQSRTMGEIDYEHSIWERLLDKFMNNCLKSISIMDVVFGYNPNSQFKL